VSDAIPVLTDRKSLLSEDSLLERVIAAAEERQLSIHSSPQPAHNRVSTGSRRIAVPPWQCAVGLHSNYKNLLAVEDAFRQLKSYPEVRPVFHWRPDRVRNHVRLCFIAYWLCARLGNEWRAKGEKGEVQRAQELSPGSSFESLIYWSLTIVPQYPALDRSAVVPRCSGFQKLGNRVIFATIR
jgi:hypothetical protein